MLLKMACFLLGNGQTIGKHWGQRFIQRHGLSTILSRQLDYQRAWNGDPVIIHDWFAFFRAVRKRYQVKYSKFINNFDEKGVILGLAAVAWVIMSDKTCRERLKN